MNKSQKHHLAQIKEDFENMLNDTKKEAKRKEEKFRQECEDRENALKEKLRKSEHLLTNEAQPRIQQLEKEMSELISDLHSLSSDVENLKNENEGLHLQLQNQITSSEEIIDVKDGQIQHLKICNQRLTESIEEYESKEKDKIKELREDHLKLQVDFEKVCSELESKEEEQKERLQE